MPYSVPRIATVGRLHGLNTQAVSAHSLAGLTKKFLQRFSYVATLISRHFKKSLIHLYKYRRFIKFTCFGYAISELWKYSYVI